jgi:hypothetical protein
MTALMVSINGVMWMNGTLAELMAKTDPKLYPKYLTNEKGKKVLYLPLQKALYGMIKSALIRMFLVCKYVH